MKTYIILFILILVGIALSFAYKHLSAFSLGSFGLRHLMKWKSSTDTLGNWILFLCFVFCCTYWMIDRYWIYYSILVLFSTICTMARVSKLPKKNMPHPKWTVFCYWMVGLIGWFCAVHSGASANVLLFKMDVFSHAANTPIYFLTHVSFMVTILQGVLMWIPVWILWNHFKYMRCQKMVRAKNVYTLTIKLVFVCIVMWGLYAYGFHFLDLVYQVGKQPTMIVSA